MTNEVKNFYSSLPKKFINKSYNPMIKNHRMELPFRATIIGASGSMKTNTLLDLIIRMTQTFEEILVCCKSRDEPLYNYLASLSPSISFYESTIPPITDGGQRLIVFDDLVLDKDLQKQIAEYFIRGRKKNYSCVYISQSYYKIPKIIRINASHILLKRLNSKRDLKLILSEFDLGVDPKLLEQMYKYSTDTKTSFFMISVLDEDNRRFRKNFLEFLKAVEN